MSFFKVEYVKITWKIYASSLLEIYSLKHSQLLIFKMYKAAW